MKIVVYGLVLANLLYFGWAEWIDVPAPPARSSIAGLPHLTLVSELSPQQRAALARKRVPETPAPQCVSVGPFDDPAVAVQAAALLKAKSLTPQQRAVEDPSVRRFWVYLEGFTSDASEMRVLHRLESAGIDDAEAMPADAGGRRVSLGLFTDRDRAERRARAVRTLGFKPAMSERLLPGTVYWLDLTLANGTVATAAVPLKDISALQPGSSSPSIGLQPCPTAPAPAPPVPQTQAPASGPPTAPAAAPQAASPDPASARKTTLPICKPGVPAPCVVLKETTRPSVL